jgi:putative transposase
MDNKKSIDTKAIVSTLLKKANPEDFFSKGGIFQQLKKQLVERILESELNHELGYPKHSKDVKQTDNSRNGSYSKTLIDEEGNKIPIDVPRDREGKYSPQFIPKGVRRFEGFDEKVISLYARGMTVREIRDHLEELYQTSISPDLISTITNGVLEEVNTWQTRPLDNIYPVLYLDCIHVKSRENHTVINKAVYLAIGINIEGKKELLGIWISKNEGSKFWMQVCTELKTRGVKKIYVACVDGLKGFPEAINSIFPKTIVQLCIVHMVRNSLKYVSYKDRKELIGDLKNIYSSINEEEAVEYLCSLGEKWDEKYWSSIIPLFTFPPEIRKAIYTTNIIESANRQIRKIIKNKGVFPDDSSIKKIIFFSLRNASKKWTMPIKNWPLALNQFELLCGEMADNLPVI